jgi:hypothetical protein
LQQQGCFTPKCLKEEEEIRSFLRWVLHHCLGEQLAVASTVNPFFFFSLVSESEEEGGGGCSGGVGFWVSSFFPSWHTCVHAMREKMKRTFVVFERLQFLLVTRGIHN